MLIRFGIVKILLPWKFFRSIAGLSIVTLSFVGFGFIETTFEGREVGPAYAIPVGFYSGPVSTTSFFIDVTLSTITTSKQTSGMANDKLHYSDCGYIMPVCVHLCVCMCLCAFIVASNDIKLNTPRLTFDGANSFQNVSISLIPDNIALERNETFRISLGLGNLPLAQMPSFTSTQLNGIVIDTDSE